jgi:hypothetical protein
LAIRRAVCSGSEGINHRDRTLHNKERRFSSRRLSKGDFESPLLDHLKPAFPHAAEDTLAINGSGASHLHSYFALIFRDRVFAGRTMGMSSDGVKRTA